jgi:hypothetical protein
MSLEIADPPGLDEPTETVAVRLPKSVIERVDDLAKIAERSRSNYLALLIQRAVVAKKAAYIRELDYGFFWGTGAPELAVLVVPLPYEEVREQCRSIINGTFSEKTLVESVTATMSADPSSRSSFWRSSFNWSPGEDYFDIYVGNEEKRLNAIRLRLSADGVVRYVRPLPLKEEKPHFHIAAFRELIEEAIYCASEVYRRLGLSSGEVAISVALRHAPTLTVETYRLDFIPQGYMPRPMLEPADLLALPKNPVVVNINSLRDKAQEISQNVVRVLETKLAQQRK